MLSKHVKDITGMRFGILTVLSPTDRVSSNGGLYWLCRCDCGKTKAIPGGSLRAKTIKSCGCREHVCRHVPQIEVNGAIAYMKLNGRKGASKIVILDTEDVERVQGHSWCLGTSGYAESRINGGCMRLHRFLLDVPSTAVVDHCNRNKLDNRKSNLRICTQTENTHNAAMLSTNTSGYRGVWYRTSAKLWIASAETRGKKSYLGGYKTVEEAARAYDRYVIANRDQHAVTNFPRSDYQ